MQLYPWQQAQWQQLMARRQQLPHALLLTGAAGMGKLQFAQLLAQHLLCQAPDSLGYGCNQCKHCQLIQAGHHPDLYQLTPQETGKVIRIEQVRELINWANQTAQLSVYKIVIIEPADALNHAASNALLKTLEEPAAATLFLLVTAKPLLLAPTIRSRCQRIAFRSNAAVTAWLNQHLQPHQQALLALTPVSGPLQIKAWFEEGKADQALQWLNDLSAVAFKKLAIVAMAKRYAHIDLIELIDIWLMALHQQWLAAASSWPLPGRPEYRWFDFVTELYHLKKQLLLKQNLNQQLQLESVLWHWVQLFVNVDSKKP